MTDRKTLEELFDENAFAPWFTLEQGNITTTTFWPDRVYYSESPTRFPNRFPEKATLKELETNVWWWRYANKTADYSSVFPGADGIDPFLQKLHLDLFLEGMQESAYFYELRARYRTRYQWDFDACWPNCTVLQKRFLDCLIPPAFPRTTHYGQENEHWVQFPKFNLQLGNVTLVNYFKALLSQARINTWNPKPGTGKGARKRDLSWRAVELIDKKRYLKAVHNESERSTVSTALEKYRAICTKLGIKP